MVATCSRSLPLLGVRVAAANGQCATSADDLAVRHDAVTGRRC